MSSAILFNLDQCKILSSSNELALCLTILSFNNLKEKFFENIMGKGENAGITLKGLTMKAKH